jgi:hypothetical protein
LIFPVAIGFAAVLFAGIYFLEWRASRLQAKELVQMATDAAGAGVRNVTQAVLKNQALLQRLQSDLEEIKGLAREYQPTPLNQPASQESEAASLPNKEPAPDTALPPLPVGLDIVSSVTTADLDFLLRSEKLNPRKKELGKVDRMRAEAVLAKARATSDVLESEIRVDLTAGMERMREQGAFVSYARDEMVPPDKGTITAGEVGENGAMRLYYFYPEQYPDIYQRKQAIKAACEVAIREVLSLLE